VRLTLARGPRFQRRQVLATNLHGSAEAMSSTLTMRLRILNGTHAGACIDLQEGEQSIGREPERDINVTDWTEPTLCLCCDTAGQVLLRWPERAPSGKVAARGTGAMVPFQPERFGDIVLCVGSTVAAWPTDMELLARVFEPKPARLGKWMSVHARPAAAVRLSGAMVLVAVVWFGMGMVQTPSKAAAVPVSLERVADGLRVGLAQAGQRGLKVQLVAGGIELSGLTESREEARAVRQLLAALPGEVAIVPHFAVAEELAETLRSSIGIAGAKVRHLGDGAFAIEAAVQDFNAARAAIDRVVADLAPHVKRVDFAESGAGQRFNGLPVTAAYSDGQTSIVQTQDGAIHLVVTSAEADVKASRRSPQR
jgi:type III secretion protein D